MGDLAAAAAAAWNPRRAGEQPHEQWSSRRFHSLSGAAFSLLLCAPVVARTHCGPRASEAPSPDAPPPLLRHSDSFNTT